MFNSVTFVQKVTLVVTYVLLVFSFYFYVTDLAQNHNLFQTWLNAWTDTRQWLLTVPASVCSVLWVTEELKKP